jgi:hypothetical protein
MSTISGTHTVAVTLDSGSPQVTVTGTVDAYSSFGVYGGQTVSGAVFGPAGTGFLVHNKGRIESDGTSGGDGGIVLGSPGTVLNGGTVTGGSGILMFGGAGGVVQNSRLVEGAAGFGIYLQGTGTVTNSGSVAGGVVGVALAGGGYAENTGHIAAATGIAVTGAAYSYVYNTGHILATTGDGVTLRGSGVVSNTGGVQAGADGVALAGGGIVYNYGVLQAGERGVDLQSGGFVYNSQRIKGGVGVYAKGAAEYVYNYATAQITGKTIGVELAAGGVVGNAGTITGTTIGIVLAGGTVENEAGGVIAGKFGVRGKTKGVDVYNAGTIIATAKKAAIDLTGGGTIDNTGLISDKYGMGISMSGAIGTVINSGVIYAGFGYYHPAGVDLSNGALFKNFGTIESDAAVYQKNGGTFVNYGMVEGSSVVGPRSTLLNLGVLYGGNSPPLSADFDTVAVYASDGGIVFNSGTIRGRFEQAAIAGDGGTIVNDNLITTNFNSLNDGATGVIVRRGSMLINNGKIMGGGDAIYVSDGGTIVNAGTITSPYDAVLFKASYANRLIVMPSAAFYGTVDIGGGVLELGAGSLAGQVTLSASQVTDFGSIQVDAGAIWGFVDATKLGKGVTVTNDGTIAQGAGASLSIVGPVEGTGAINIGNAGLELGGSVSSGQQISFTGLGETLALGDAPGFAGTIGGFAAGETILLEKLSQFDVRDISLSGDVLTIDTVGGSIALTFANGSDFGSENFHDFKDGNGVGITLTGGGKMAFLAQPGSAASAGVATESYLPAGGSSQPVTPPPSQEDDVAGLLIHDLLKAAVAAVPVTFHV